MRRIVGIFVLVCAFAAFAQTAEAQNRCDNGRSKQAAMWYSIAHPGLGEYYLKGWGSFRNLPQKKFWLGFIPLYGWPGYLQIKSADDAFHCQTNDGLTFSD